MAKVVTTPATRRDLIEIWRYIAADSLDHADQFLNHLHEQFTVLAENPRMGRQRHRLMPELAPELRSLPIGSYVIFYQPLSPPGGIKVIRVLHGAQDVENQL